MMEGAFRPSAGRFSLFPRVDGGMICPRRDLTAIGSFGWRLFLRVTVRYTRVEEEVDDDTTLSYGKLPRSGIF